VPKAIMLSEKILKCQKNIKVSKKIIYVMTGLQVPKAP
jgi:hypothetical protein